MIDGIWPPTVALSIVTANSGLAHLCEIPVMRFPAETKGPMHRLSILFLLLIAVPRFPSELPVVRIEAPAQLAAVRARLESATEQRFSDIVQLVGIAEAGEPIPVLLALEDSPQARGVPSWISGYATGPPDRIVLFPERSPSYPNDTLEDVLRHEVTHVLIRRAAGEERVPRWFNEGLAMAAERERRFADRSELIFQLMAGPRPELREIDRLFDGGQNDQTRAYALAGAIVDHILETRGSSSCGEMLKRMHGGARFDAAFAAVTGMSPQAMEAEFWQSQRIWTSWFPMVTSSTTVWMAVTFLALLAIYARHRRNRAIQERWSREDDEF